MSANSTAFASTLQEPHLSALPPERGGDELLRGRLMQRSLQRLLDRVADARTALPHLAALETSLGQRGTAALQGVSQKALAKVQHQLRALPLDPADGHIQDLLALVQRTLRELAREPRTHQLLPNDPQSTVVISEGSESDFMNALAEARGGGADGCAARPWSN
jgi:hypothetical protein